MEQGIPFAVDAYCYQNLLSIHSATILAISLSPSFIPDPNFIFYGPIATSICIEIPLHIRSG